MDPSYCRRSKSEDEFALFVLPTLGEPSHSSRRPMHTSILTGARRVNEILNGHEDLCKRHFRMETDIFQALVQKLRENDRLVDGRDVSVEEQVAIFLYALSKNATNDTLADWFQHSGQTFHEYINEFFNIVPILASRFLKPPNIDEPHPKISTDTRFYPYFQVSIFNASTIPFLI